MIIIFIDNYYYYIILKILSDFIGVKHIIVYKYMHSHLSNYNSPKSKKT